jgi:hypothetical protein
VPTTPFPHKVSLDHCIQRKRSRSANHSISTQSSPRSLHPGEAKQECQPLGGDAQSVHTKRMVEPSMESCQYCATLTAEQCAVTELGQSVPLNWYRIVRFKVALLRAISVISATACDMEQLKCHARDINYNYCEYCKVYSCRYIYIRTEYILNK